MPCEELDIVWNNIKAEARALADCEPMLASFYHATLLKHENLGSALSYMLANKLASSIMPAIAIREVVEEAYAADPEMIASAACDIQAVRTRDPAVDKYSTPLLYLKGFHALQAPPHFSSLLVSKENIPALISPRRTARTPVR